MRPRQFVPFAVLAFFFFSQIPIQAQTITKTAVLLQAARQKAQEEKMNYDLLLETARQKGWPLTITHKSGHRAILYGVDSKGYPLYVAAQDLGSAATIRTDQLWPGGSTGLALSGSSASMKGKMAIWDEDSVRPDHQELVGRILQKDKPTGLSDHSTHVAGILAATGVNPQAKGMAFQVPQLIAYDFNNHLSEMLFESPNLLISNHSYGSISGWNYNSDASRWEFWGNSGDTVDYKFGYYSSEAQIWDSIAYNAPNYLIVKSAGNNRDVNGPAVGQPYWRYNGSGIMVSAGNRPAGISNNDGYDIIPTYGVAKNILTIGAVNPVPGGYGSASDVVQSTFSSWGPTDDGRIKPDVVTDGVNVLSSIAAAPDAYAIYSGTSMSSPAAAGSALLLQEYYSKLHPGIFLRSATLKGLIIHTADEAGPAPGPDYQNGWGLMNSQKAAAVITSNNTDQQILENNLVNGATYTLPVVASGKGRLVATLSWTDPAASVDNVHILNNPTPKLVNDLDLRVISADSTYQPWILDPTSPGSPATNGDNHLDNVEKIEINNAIPGKSYTIQVTHKGSLARGQQAYSLLLSGVAGQTYCTSAPSSNAGTRIDSLLFSNLRTANPGTCTTFTDYTNLTGQIQANETLPLSILIGNCNGLNPSKVVKVFCDFNNNGVFTDPGETVVISPVLNTNGWYSTSVSIPGGLFIGDFIRMRVVVVETTDPNAVTPCGTYGNGETQDYILQVGQPASDVGVAELVDPQASLCASDSQRISIRIKNFGTADQINVPVTVIVSNSSGIVSSLTTVCPDTVHAQGNVVFTFQAPFRAAAGISYTVTAFTSLANDQDTSNDHNTTSLVVSTGSAAPSGKAEICGNSASLKANLTDSASVPAWYTSATATTPIAVGPVTSTTTLPQNHTYYLGLNDLPTKIGPVTKSQLVTGGYNTFSGNFVKIHNDVPVLIHSARLYIAQPGKINFIVGDIVNYDSTTGAFSYYPISSNTLDVFPTTPTPFAGAQNDLANDTGAVYLLNLPIPTVGNHAIIIDCQNGANIFRNNNLSGNIYPLTIPGVFSITGNSAVNTSNLRDTTFYRKYYYFFYDMLIQLVNCPSPRVAVVASISPAPIISLSGKTLTSNAAVGNQWYLNDTALVGQTGQTLTVTLPGSYQSLVTDSLQCAQISNTIVYVPGSGIGLTVGPNPNNGVFTVQFYLQQTENVSITLINDLGQVMYTSNYPNFSGAFSQQIGAPLAAAGVYFLRVQTGSKTYTEKILVR